MPELVTQPLPIVWVSSGRHCHGHLYIEANALHFVCLTDSSAAAAAAGNAAARQFGLLGALVGAAAGAVAENQRRKKMDEAAAAQEGLSPAKRVEQNPLSRTVARAEVVKLVQSRWTLPQLVTSGPPLSFVTVPPPTLAAFQAWCESKQIPVEKPKPMPRAIKLGLLLTPVALVLIYALAAIPSALRLNAAVGESLAGLEQMKSVGGPAVAAIHGAFGAPLEVACKDALAGKTAPELVAYVGPVPSDVETELTESYEKFPRYTHVIPAYSQWDTPRLEVDAVENKWVRKKSFLDSWGRLLESPGNWEWLSKEGGPDFSQTKLLLAGSVVRFDRGSRTATIAARVHDFHTGKAICEGDVALKLSEGSVGFGFTLSQGLPLGLLLPACHEEKELICHEAGSWAKRIDAAPPIADAPPAKSATVPASAKRHKKFPLP